MNSTTDDISGASGSAASEIAVRTHKLDVRRGGRQVLHGTSLTVRAGRVTGLLGPSGSGKTTLMRAIVGVQIVHGGAVEVLGRPAGDPALRRRVGYVTQAPSVYADLSIGENLRYFARIVDAPASRVDEAVATVGLGAEVDRIVASLSGGERSRVSLCAALLGDPDLLVLDEPTVGLDPVLRAELWETFQALTGAGKTLLVSTHVMDEATRCEDLVLIREGEVVAAAAPAELLARTGAADLEGAFIELAAAA